MQEGGGGTELAAALDDVLAVPAREDAARSVVVITDGYIYDEEEVFQKIRDHLGETDFFSFGIGVSFGDVAFDFGGCFFSERYDALLVAFSCYAQLHRSQVDV